jgi:hypothetical protein
MARPVAVFAGVGLLVASPALAAEPGTPPVPAAVGLFEGCWQGEGIVLGKATRVALRARPIVERAMTLFEVDSVAAGDPKDRYAAHLLFAGAGSAAQPTPERVWSFWADSFGGAFTATGEGVVRSDGFDVDYHYPEDVFVNRWRVQGRELRWTVVSRRGDGPEKPFAAYVLRRVSCAALR